MSKRLLGGLEGRCDCAIVRKAVDAQLGLPVSGALANGEAFTNTRCMTGSTHLSLVKDTTGGGRSRYLTANARSAQARKLATLLNLLVCVLER